MSNQQKDGIVWTDKTWNPIRGCTRVSAGCTHCYAERMGHRFDQAGQPYEDLVDHLTGRWTGKVRFVSEHLNDPLHWREPQKVFVNSMSDLFHDLLDFQDIAAIFGIMAATPHHTFQILTKRPGHMLEFFHWLEKRSDPVERLSDALERHNLKLDPFDNFQWPLPNIWLGVSIEDQASADQRIPLLLQTPAAVRWVSCEPLLEFVEIEVWLHPIIADRCLPGDQIRAPRWGSFTTERYCGIPRPALNWVVVGGELGPHSRVMDLDWARSLRDQCAAAHVAFLFKQRGGPRRTNGYRLLDGVLHDAYPVR